MKITIEIEDDRDLEKIAHLLRSEHLTIIGKGDEQAAVIRDLARSYNAHLPNGYSFDRDEANER